MYRLEALLARADHRLDSPDRKVERARVEVGGIERVAISQPLSGVIRFPSLALEESPKLRFLIATDSVLPEAGGALCEVIVSGRDKEQAVYRRRLTAAEGSQAWLRQEVDLGRFAGQRIDLELRVESGPGARASVLWGEPRLTSEKASPHFLPNVVMVSFDTLRADFLAAYGYPDSVSPNIDRIAADGTLFENCVSQSAWTRPAHFSMLTARYPKRALLTFGRHQPVDNDANLLAEMLMPADYLCAAYTGGGFLGHGSGFEQGFAYFHSSGRRFEDNLPEVLDWLESHARTRFFLFLHGYSCHRPYDPPAEIRELFAPAPPAECIGVTFSNEDARQGRSSACRRAPGGNEYLRGVYAGEVFYADSLFGQVLDRLGELGVLDETIFIVTSDHGEELWEHGNGDHVKTVYQELLHVPLIFSGPGIQRQRISHNVGLIDIVPTLLELLGLPPSAGDGRSLAPALRGEPLSPRPIFAATAWAPDSHIRSPFDFKAALVSDHRKLILRRGPGRHDLRLFDLTRDSFELDGTDVSDEGELATMLGDWVAAVRDHRLDPSPSELDPVTRRQLEALGYLDSDIEHRK